jgi:hypothetical protein
MLMIESGVDPDMTADIRAQREQFDAWLPGALAQLRADVLKLLADE